MIGLNADSSKMISIALTTANTPPLTVYAAQSCGKAYYMSRCDYKGAKWVGVSAAIAGASVLVLLN